MHARRVAIAGGMAIAIGASAFLLVNRPPAVGPIHAVSIVDLPAGGLLVPLPREQPQPRPGPFPHAQPCLIDTVSCLELSPEPFAPCLLAVERCSGEWRLHPLVEWNAGPKR